MCKRGDTLSLRVLIGRGLDLLPRFLSIREFLSNILPFASFSVLRVFLKATITFAPLAQLVEHLTLNQGVPGSSP